MTARRSRGGLIDSVRLPFEAVDSVAAAKEAFLGLFLFGRTPRRRRAKSAATRPVLGEFSHLVRLFRSALGSGEADELVSLLNAFTNNREQIQIAFILWLDLIEVLVQTAERRYGAARGQGKIKTREVKAVLKYLLESGRFSLPKLPQPLARLVLDSVIEWAIDLIVLQANRYDLWEIEPIPRSVRSRLWDAVKRATLAVVMRLANLLARFVDGVQRLLEPKPAISPALSAALAAIEREGAIVGQQDLIVRVSRLFIWVGTHRAELVNVSEVVFGAVEEVEFLLTMTGVEKKQFARDLIWSVLEEMGFAPRSGLLEAVMDSVIDLLIESSVHFFNKRAAFEHAPRARA